MWNDITNVFIKLLWMLSIMLIDIHIEYSGIAYMGLQICLFNISFSKQFRKVWSLKFAKKSPQIFYPHFLLGTECKSTFLHSPLHSVCICLWERGVKKGGQGWWNKILLEENSSSDTFINLFGTQICSLTFYLFAICFWILCTERDERSSRVLLNYCKKCSYRKKHVFTDGWRRNNISSSLCLIYQKDEDTDGLHEWSSGILKLIEYRTLFGLTLLLS